MSKINGNLIQNNLRADVLNKASKVLDNKNSIDFSSKIPEAIKEVANSPITTKSTILFMIEYTYTRPYDPTY